MQQEYGKDLRIVYKHFVVHPGVATIPAEAACAAHLQGGFEPMLGLLWDRAYANRRFEQQYMEELADEIGLDHDRFVADMTGPCRQIVQQDQQDLAAVGVRGTPAFFINGRYLSGAQPIDRFRTLIDEELALANRRLKKGGSAKRYYDTWVLKKGKKSI